MTNTEHPIGTFVESTLEKAHISLHVMTVFGLFDGLTNPATSIQKPTVWSFILAINWFVAVAVVYTFIAFIVGALLAILVSDFAFRDKDNPKQKAFAAAAPTPLLIMATILGIVMAILSKGTPGIHDEIAGIILFRLIGFAAMGFSLLVLLGAILSAFEHKQTIK